MRKIPPANPAEKEDLSSQYPQLSEAGGDMTLSCAGRLFERAGQRTAEDKREGDKAGK